jgi:uncharacterized linocin/CFP29 family protein
MENQIIAATGTLDAFMNSNASVAQRLLASNLDINVLRPVLGFHANATLRKDEWEALDAAAISSFLGTLNAVEDLRSRGLVQNLGGMGVLLSQYNRLSEMNRAQVSMWASIDAQQSRMAMDLVGVPIPVIFSEFQLDIRFLAVARRGGTPIDTLQADEAGRVVADELEHILFNGNATVWGGTPIYGYLNHPNRNTAAGASWGTATNIYPNVLTMYGALRADNVPGPYMLYLHHDQFMESLVLSDTTNQISVRQSILNSLPNLIDIKDNPKVPTGQGVMVSMDRRTVDLAVAEDFMPVEWESRGGLTTHYRGMTVAAPRVKADFSGRCGIYHITGI